MSGARNAEGHANFSFRVPISIPKLKYTIKLAICQGEMIAQLALQAAISIFPWTV